MNKLVKVLNACNYIIIVISFVLFWRNDYLGMVSEDMMLAYAWVGTSKTRMMSIFGNPNHAGLYFIIMLCILDYFRVKEGKKFICMSNILLVICNLLTFSRTSIFCLIVYLYIRNKMVSRDKKYKRITYLLNKYKILILTAIVLIAAYMAVNKYNIYFFNLDYLLNGSRGQRWIIGLQYILGYSMIGAPFNSDMSGLSESYGEIIFSDNMFIEIGARFGICLMVVAIIYIFYLLFKYIKIKSFVNLNKLQIFIIPSILSGTLHFSIPVLLFIIYALLCTEFKKEKSINDK
ncbi:hypothetical protein [Clostridium sp.]|uniref:hypothetical protein n=1 Tax=Clostridium sp. TaxID=1506 RepID=UPI002846F10B|nr:hypothetical protein [Clostridium sp.]MDR3594807.1 hypothetical protein [Clostridium sp.]